MIALPSVRDEMAGSRQPRVLVVDDEEHITELVSMGLGYNGFDVERASTGRAALDAIDKRKPDLIVLDVMLPDLDGFELTRRVRQNEGAGTRVPIIFLTAKDTTADKIQGLRLGSDDYVTKPFSIEELIERVKAVLRRATGEGPGERELSAFIDQESRRMSARAAWGAYFEDVDVFLCPVNFTPAFAHDQRPFEQRTIATPEGERSYMQQPFWTSHAWLDASRR